MEIKINIDDQKIRSFSWPAKQTLKSSLEEYTENIIETAKLIEGEQRSTHKDPEVNATHVSNAVVKYKTKPQRNWKTLFYRILSELLIFAAGLLATPDNFIKSGQLNIGYSIIFLLIALSALFFSMITYTAEG